MVDRVAPRRRRAYGFAGMIALVVAVEVFVGLRRDLADPVGLEWRGGDKAIRGRAKQADVLCLGDSMMKYGISASVLEARLGRRVANFAMTAAPASASYFALSHAIEAGARPRLILVDYAPFLLLPGYQLNQRYLADAFDLKDSLDLAWSSADFEVGGAMLLSQFVPTVHNRDSLRARAKRNWPKPPEAGKAQRRPDLWLPGGNQEVYGWFYPPAWECGPDHQLYVERLIDLAARHGATVVWLMTPVGDPIRKEWKTLDLDARYTRFAEAIQARFANLVVIDGREVPLDDSDRTDPLHLSRRGAEAFTERVADHLGRISRGSPWVDMNSSPRRPWEARDRSLADQPTPTRLDPISREDRPNPPG